MRSPVLQNDDRLNQYINDAGCLYRSLTHLVEMQAGENFDDRALLKLYDRLVRLNGQSKYRGMKQNCFVMSHEDVLQVAIDEFGKDWKPFYVKKESQTSEIRSWFSSYEVEPNGFILHAGVNDNNIGHFMVSDISFERAWDPFFPATRINEIRSYRYYAIVE